MIAERHIPEFSAFLTVSGPGNRLLKMECRTARVENDQIFIVKTAGNHGRRKLPVSIHPSGIFEQNQLAHSVAEADHRFRKMNDSGYRCGIGHASVHQFPLKNAVVIFNACGDLFNFTQLSSALQNIGQLAQRSFLILWGGIADLGKRAECGYIGKIRVFSETADVKGVRLAGEHAYGAGNRVFVIEQAENMNESAQNALLKTLEEPQPGVVFLLLTDMAGMLLSTIRSRCREIQLHLWPDSKVLAVLRAHGVAEATALAAAQAAGGSIGRALAIASDTAWWERRKRLMEDFFGLEKRSDIPLVSADWREQKGEADALFDDLTGMVQTLMLVRYSRADKAQLADYPDAWQRMAQQGDAAAFVRLLDAILVIVSVAIGVGIVLTAVGRLGGGALWK